MQKKSSHQQDPPVWLTDVMSLLRVSERRMRTWIREGRVVVHMAPDGKEAMKMSDLKTLAHSPEAHEAALEGLAWEAQRREADELSGRNSQFSEEIARRVMRYREYIQTVEDIHSYYGNRLDVLHDESAVVAAYLLYAKVISLLKMTCLCLEHHFWNALILLRPIDEAIQLAEYFIHIETDTQGVQNLRKWFRENRSPQNAVCRQAIGKYMDSIAPLTTNRPLEAVMVELHGKKSKEVHHTCNGIWETYRAKIENGKLVPIGFDYGPCSHPRKILEVAEFFQSSIWTALQGFLLCFYERLPLEQDHIDRLKALEQLFRKAASHR